jgi:hypothetical protein
MALADERQSQRVLSDSTMSSSTYFKIWRRFDAKITSCIVSWYLKYFTLHTYLYIHWRGSISWPQIPISAGGDLTTRPRRQGSYNGLSCFGHISKWFFFRQILRLKCAKDEPTSDVTVSARYNAKNRQKITKIASRENFTRLLQTILTLEMILLMSDWT